MIHNTFKQTALHMWVLLLLAVSSNFASATIIIEQCGQEDFNLHSYLQAFTDPTKQQDITDIDQLPEGAWQAASAELLNPGFSNAAHWYRLSIASELTTECEYWLDLDSLHSTDIQVFTRSDTQEQWHVQRAGANYPFADWAGAQREPSIPVTLAPQADTELVFRVSSKQAVLLEPQLLPLQTLIKKRMITDLQDGVIYGVVSLLVILSLLIGFFFRLKVLIPHALSVLFYTLYLSSVAGYAFVHLWPDAVIWNAQAIIILSAAMRITVLRFISELLRINKQPKRSRYFLLLVQIGFLVLMGLRLTFPDAQWAAESGSLSVLIHLAAALMIVFALYMGQQQTFSYTGFSYFIALFVAFEFFMFALFAAGTTSIPPLEYRLVSVATVPALLLLSYTLINKLAGLRQREQQTQSELEHLKHAEQGALEQRVAIRTEQLRNALNSQNMLLARISHDLRAPLQHVIRDAGLLQQRTEQATEYGHSIQRAAHQQLELIDELLEYSRGELKQLELLIAPGYFFGFLHELKESGAFLAERNHNEFVSELSTDLPLLVSADFRRLRQVVMNLLANAAKFTNNGLIEFKVSLVRLDKQAGHADVQFSVSDNGIGILEQERKNLLEPFQRGSSSANYQGVGLGLYIVRQLLESMYSQLEIETSPSGGVQSHFTLRLELAGEQELEQVYVESYNDSSEGQQRCVLIVDDIEIAQEMLYELLAGYDYNPIVCSGAAEALVILREHWVDIVITDQVMPVMDGWDLLRKVRQERPELPVLLYSARPPVRPKGLDPAIEFDACLLKPATTSNLLEKIEYLLSQK